MSTYGNPSIVHDSSLTLSLDSGNIKSYIGSGTAWNDISGNGNNCTLVNGPTYSGTTNGGSFTFNGSNQYGTCAGTPLNVTSYTKVAWFMLTSYSTNNNIVSGYNGSGGHFTYFGTGNRLLNGHSDWGSYNAYQSNTVFNLNTWYNICVTFSTSNGFVLYVNGIQDSTYTTQKTQATGGYVEIGAYSGGNLLAGKMGQALIYNRVLSASEALRIYNATRRRYDLYS